MGQDRWPEPGNGHRVHANTTTDLSACPSQASPPSEPLTASLGDRKGAVLPALEATPTTMYSELLGSLGRSRLPATPHGPDALDHAQRRQLESPWPWAPPPSLAKPEQMSEDREARTEQG